ncbi:hypothetical protein [Thalassobacillus devorans]|uniref:hypothetical protein n=1 Tax=Thalassobacillus devorans TaxID=279813 RepID=UPI00141B4ED4|nr:hypothetical protein [Thalassobacillus devorans]
MIVRVLGRWERIHFPAGELASLFENATHFLRAVFIQEAYSKSCGTNMGGEIPQEEA